MELRPPRAKQSHTQSSSAWNAVQNRKMFQLQKHREVQTQWNTSHTHLERGTNFIIIQVRLHHRTAWNAAFTTWKKTAQDLHFFPDRHVQWNAGYKAPCAKDPSITPAVAPAGAAPKQQQQQHLPCMWKRMVGMMTSTTTLRNLITSHHLTSPAIRTEHECITASALQRCFQQTLLRTRSIS